jgi:hypothetical protein
MFGATPEAMPAAIIAAARLPTKLCEHPHAHFLMAIQILFMAKYSTVFDEPEREYQKPNLLTLRYCPQGTLPWIEGRYYITEGPNSATTDNRCVTNREHPPDFINIRVEELVGDRPFDDLDKFITQDELRALSEQYKRVAGFSLGDVGAP